MKIEYFIKFYNNKVFRYLFCTLVFLFFNLVIAKVFINKKIDLTNDKLFTVSENTKNIIKDLNEPITIKLFFSNSLSKEFSQIRDYERRVRELLLNYVNISDENIILESIDPKPFTDQEDLANIYGIEGLQLNEEGERFYFGAALSNSVDDTSVIPFFELNREQFLEYDLTKTIYNLANTSKSKIGIISNLPLVGRVNNFQGNAQYEDPYYLYTTIQEFFDITDLSADINKIPNDLDQLLVIHPQELSDETLYAIDQFVMSGKGATFFVDPFSEEDNNSSRLDQENGISHSGLSKLFS